MVSDHREETDRLTMSRSDQPDGAPSNSELAERTARIEANVEHVAETVDRIEETVTEDLEETTEQVEAVDEKVATMWPVYRFGRWVLPIGVGVAGALASLASAGVV